MLLKFITVFLYQPGFPGAELELTALSGFVVSCNLCCPLKSDAIEKGQVICRQFTSQTQV
jgi:hypothetical protein